MRSSRSLSDGSGWQPYRHTTEPGPGPDGPLKIVSASGHWLHLSAADGATVRYNVKTHSFSRRPTCAPRYAPWASKACPESAWVRGVVAAAGGRITGVTDGIEPQRGSAFLIELDGRRLSFGAVSRDDMRRMGGFFSMGMFGAGMPQSGHVRGIPLFGDRTTGHWSWEVRGFTVEIYRSHAPRSVIVDLVDASVGVP
jgi:hypothetical protein